MIDPGTPIYDALVTEHERRANPLWWERLLEMLGFTPGYGEHPLLTPAQIVVAILLGGLMVALVFVCLVGLLV